MCRLNFLVVGGVKIRTLGLDAMGIVGGYVKYQRQSGDTDRYALKGIWGGNRLTERKFPQNVITYGLYKVVILSHLKRDLFGENLKIKMLIV